MLGWKGEVAKEFAGLLKQVWQPNTSSVSPLNFKRTIGKCAPMFAGYQQHDSHELMAFLLDACHEDLNRVLKKPATEQIENDGSRTDAEVASESWDIYQQRNRSVVVDHFQGQLRSEATCLECGRKSVKFDESMYLSVPLPQPTHKQMDLTLVLKDVLDAGTASESAPRKYVVDVEIDGTVADLKAALAKLASVKSEDLYMCEVYQQKHYKDYADTMPLKDIQDADLVWAYELPGHAAGKVVQIVQRRKKATTWSTTPEKFSYPTFLATASSCTCAEVYEQVDKRASSMLKPGETERFAALLEAANMDIGTASQKATELANEAQAALTAGDAAKAIEVYTSAVNTLASKVPSAAAPEDPALQVYTECILGRAKARILGGKDFTGADAGSRFSDAEADCGLAMELRWNALKNDEAGWTANDAPAMQLRAEAMELQGATMDIRSIRALLWRVNALKPGLPGVAEKLAEFTEKKSELCKEEAAFRPQTASKSIKFHNETDEEVKLRPLDRPWPCRCLGLRCHCVSFSGFCVSKLQFCYVLTGDGLLDAERPDG